MAHLLVVLELSSALGPRALVKQIVHQTRKLGKILAAKITSYMTASLSPLTEKTNVLLRMTVSMVEGVRDPMPLAHTAPPYTSTNFITVTTSVPVGSISSSKT